MFTLCDLRVDTIFSFYNIVVKIDVTLICIMCPCKWGGLGGGGGGGVQF